ncbi:MAG: hypothetical protein SFU98_19745 [Leptospiraceae bacterium]|nr:hypothetical protein [Leptospiraceae bacterium]
MKILLILTLLITFCKKTDSTVSDNSNSDSSINGSWAEERLSYGYALEVDEKANTLHLTFSGEGCPLDRNGSIQKTQDGFSFTLNPSKDGCGENQSRETKTSGNCKITPENTVLTTHKLTCTGIPNLNELLLFKINNSVDQEEKYEGVTVITIRKEGTTTSDVIMRSEPNEKSKPKACNFEATPQSTPQTVIRKGATFHVIARTKEKVKVKELENYWYLIDARNDWYSNCSQAWVFAEYVKL